MPSQSVLATLPFTVPNIRFDPPITSTSGLTVQFAFTPWAYPPRDPVDGDWVDAVWVSNTDGTFDATLEVGPDGHALAAGRWAAWWRVLGATSHPVVKAGVLIITSSQDGVVIPAGVSPVLSVDGSLPDVTGNVNSAATSDATTTTKGIVKLAGDLAGTAASPTVPGLTAKSASLTRTAVKTANYTAAANDLVPVDTTSASRTVTLPTAPASGTRVCVKHIIQGGSNTVTIACAGSDVFNKTSGSTTLTLTLVNQALTVQYDSGVWTVVSDDLPLAQLDGRFLGKAGGTLTGLLVGQAGLRLDTAADPSDTVNGYTGMAVINPPTTDHVVEGLLVKVPDASWGVGQDYAKGNALLFLSDADSVVAAATAPTPLLKTISATTNASPVQVTTSTTHGFNTGDVVRITDTAISALDGKFWKITVVDTTHFTLNGSTAPGSTAAVGSAFTNQSAVLARLADTGAGIMSMHVAPGLHGRSGSVLPTQGVWVQAHADIPNLILDNAATTVCATTPTANFFSVRDTRGGTYSLVQISADGTLRSNKAFAATSRLTSDITALLTAISSQTGELLRAVDATGVKRVAITAPTGLTQWYADDGSAAAQIAGNSSGNASYRAIFNAINTGVGVLGLTTPSSGTADFITMIAGGTTKHRFNKGGYSLSRLTAIPVLADMVDNEVTFWLDTVTPALKVTARISGALKTGTVTLS